MVFVKQRRRKKFWSLTSVDALAQRQQRDIYYELIIFSSEKLFSRNASSVNNNLTTFTSYTYLYTRSSAVPAPAHNLIFIKTNVLGDAMWRKVD